jgi:DNA (cytosine-5)-methyltransferase 1
MKYIEIFAGIGGFRRAMELLQKDSKVGFKCVGFSEIDIHAINTYSSNYDLNGEVRMNNITEFVESETAIQNLPDFDLLVGGFPCQAFSSIGKQKGFDDARGSILFSVEEILKVKKPNFVVLENVRHIEKHDGGKTLQKIKDFFKEMGYEVKTVILDTQFFNLPQKRNRLFIICSRIQIDFEINSEDVIDNFRKLKKVSLNSYENIKEVLDKDVDKKYYLSERIKHTILASGTKKYIGNSQIDLDIARTLTATMMKMHRACQDNYYSDDFILNDISHKLTDKEILYKKPVRRLTPKEALKLQGFDAAFFDKAIDSGVSEHQLYKQAGNALSVNTGYALLHFLFVKHTIQKKIDYCVI